ncbi:MAG: cbb3-type cytochrome oxidase subunit 3 [Pseudomonadales bacterium]
MSYEDYGPYISVIMLITFIGLFVWVLLPGNKRKYDEASQLPFDDDAIERATEDEIARVDNRREKQ